MSIKRERVPLQLSNGVVIIPIRHETSHALLEGLRADLREFLPENPAKAAIFDLKGVEILDGDEFVELTGLMKMLQLMGLRCVLCGLAPGIVAALVELLPEGADRVEIALDLNNAFDKLKKT